MRRQHHKSDIGGTNARRGRPSSRLLTTMAVVQANADQGKDYVANFEPFATERLQAWPDGQPVEPDALARAICEEWGVPSMPAGVAKILIKRAKRLDRVVTGPDGTCFPNPEKLVALPGITEKRHEMLARIHSLEDAVVDYANQVHELQWTRQDATAALLRLTEDFGAELAVARREGGLSKSPSQKSSEEVVVVYGFARRALESDPANFDALVAMVQGTMLTNTIYFKDVGHVSSKLRDLVAYLDTTVILRALGLAADPVKVAAEELLDLLRRFEVPLRIFPHTLTEISGVLDGVAGSMRKGRRGLLATEGLSNRNREAIDAMIRRGWTSGEVTAIAADLQNRLTELGVEIEETPPHRESDHIDEARLAEVLADVVGYQRKQPLQKDQESLAALDRLRGNSRPRDLADANAVFVTSNSSLVRASREFFAEANRRAPIPHCMLDTALVAQLWVRSPHPEPDLPRKLVIANSYAALNPGPELWERWIRHIVRLRERGEVTEEQVQNLVYHSQAKSVLFEVTHGNAGAIDDETVGAVLERFERELRRPAEEAAERERDRADRAERERQEIAERLEAAERLAEQATAEHEALHGELEHLSRRVSEQEERENERARRRDKMRRVLGYGGAAGVIAVSAVLALLGMVAGRVAWATLVSVAVLLAAGAWAWGTRRPLSHALRVLVAVGAALALWFGVYAIVPDGRSGAAAPPPSSR